MNGAREYAELFYTGQYERLYLVSGQHARGRTFHIYVLPKGEEARPNGPGNGPRNTNAVEVYGIISGQPGWTETYGWIHAGKWQEDFADLVVSHRAKREAEKQERERSEKAEAEAETARRLALLDTYR